MRSWPNRPPPTDRFASLDSYMYACVIGCWASIETLQQGEAQVYRTLGEDHFAAHFNLLHPALKARRDQALQIAAASAAASASSASASTSFASAK